MKINICSIFLEIKQNSQVKTAVKNRLYFDLFRP
jgi:hypothetical protein